MKSGPDDDRYTEVAAALVDAVDAVIADWIRRLVLDRAAAAGPVSDEVDAAARAAGERARAKAVPELRALVRADIDAQTNNPLAVLRDATRHAHDVLAANDVPPARRDRFAEEAFPDDAYDLAPATWADIHPTVQEPGIAWGAAKAFLHKARRRDEGTT